MEGGRSVTDAADRTGGPEGTGRVRGDGTGDGGWNDASERLGGSRYETAARLADADEHLEAVLETVDLERDRELAEAVLAALSATDRAYRLEARRSVAASGVARRFDPEGSV